MSERARKVFESRGFASDLDLNVKEIKARAAALWESLDNISVPPGNTEAGRLVSLAKTELESAVMWAIKAISRENP